MNWPWWARRAVMFYPSNREWGPRRRCLNCSTSLNRGCLCFECIRAVVVTALFTTLVSEGVRWLIP